MLAVLVFITALVRPTDLTFVRHGETLANATGRYNSRTIDTFSPKGEREVQALTQQLLRSPRFDRILVSPSPRALRTIAPYLRASHQRAIVWPLLYECCTGRRPKNAHATSFGYGSKIKVPSDIAALFVVPASGDRYPASPDYNAGLAQAVASLREFKAYAGHRVLVVGHSGHGGQFLQALTGKWIKLWNTRPVHFVLR